MRAPLVTVLLVAAGLAGCLSGGEERAGVTSQDPMSVLSAPRFAVLPPEEVWVASLVDGAPMHNAVYRPDTDGPVPVFINFSPYWGDSAMAEGDHFAQYMIHEYVPRGYAVVLSAVRGTGHSEGCFQIGGDQELRDAHEVIDFFSKEPWSNGAVAAGGKSYDSTTQNGLIAKFPHPALKALLHVSGITDMYRYNYRNGVPYSHGSTFNTYYFLDEGLDEYGLDVFGGPPLVVDPRRANPSALADDGARSLSRIAGDAACPELADMQASGVGSAIHGIKSEYWQERDWNTFVGASTWKGGIFFVHGLQDWNVKPDHILPWLAALPDGVDVKGWLHQWTREPEGGHVYPMRDDWNVTMLRFLDHWLKGIDTGLMEGPAFEVQGSDGLWRNSEAWPPQDDLDAAAAGIPLSDFDVSRFAGREIWSGTVAAASEAPLRYAGAPTLTLSATTSHGDPVVTAVLFDEAPDGTFEWVNEAVLRGILADGLAAPVPVEPGTAREYTLGFYPGDAVLAPGHKWVLAIGSDTLRARPLAAQLVGVTFDLSSAALHVPWAPVEPAAPVQPVPMDCFAC